VSEWSGTASRVSVVCSRYCWPRAAVDLALFNLDVAGVGSMLGSTSLQCVCIKLCINFLVTVANKGAQGTTRYRLRLFAWSVCFFRAPCAQGALKPALWPGTAFHRGRDSKRAALVCQYRRLSMRHCCRFHAESARQGRIHARKRSTAVPVDAAGDPHLKKVFKGYCRLRVGQGRQVGLVAGRGVALSSV